MDPLFERRQLTRMVHVEAKHLMRNIRANLLAQLSHKFDGVCVAEGYIQRKSIEIVDYSLGRTALIGGGADYRVVFRADICMPHPGQVFRANVSLKSKIGVHADITPIKALLPRDLHIGNPAFEDIAEGEEVEFEVVGSNFQQFDESIVVLGKLRTVVKPDAEVLPEVVSVETAAPQEGGNSDMKRVVTVDVGATKSAEAPRRKRIRTNPAGEANEQKQEGSA
jgi:DNA-directed RNA polymerase subunit E'/Rpb7